MLERETKLPSMAVNSLILSNGNVSFSIESHNETSGLSKRLQNFLSPFFEVGMAEITDFSISLHPYNNFFPYSHFIRSDILETKLRVSSAKPFNLSVRHGKDGDNNLIAVDSTSETAYRFLKSARHLEFFCSEKSFFHLIEFVRYTSLRCEEIKGTVILHGSAIVKDGKAILIVGHKGAGKTTTLLRAVLDSKFDFLSGDKILLSSELGRILVRGWPDYPHVGFGTLRCFPEFAKRCKVSLNAGAERPQYEDDRKVLIEPALFAAAHDKQAHRSTTELGAILFPSKPTASACLKPVLGVNRDRAYLVPHIESTSQFPIANWHNLFTSDSDPNIEQVLSLLQKAPWLEMTGLPNLDYLI